jgi:exoribonuclease R
MDVNPDFAAVRAEFGLPDGFPPAVLAEAAAAAAVRPVAGPDRIDATDVELVTIDPPGSKDLDQALGVVRHGAGFRVHYAIADLGAVVVPGAALDTEVRRRGQTVYLPDGSVPLHPPALSEDAASLLPDGPRAAVLWRIDLDGAGEPVSVEVRRAVVRSRARLDYAGVQATVDAGEIHPAIAALPEVGPLRRALAVHRGAVELELPEQEVVRAPNSCPVDQRRGEARRRSSGGNTDGGWTVQVRRRTPVEDWNAEISLLTGISAATIMLDAGIGVLRTLPAADPDAVVALRAVAGGLGIDWPAATTPAELLSGLPRDTPTALALRRAATSLLRGAGYTAFDTATEAPPPADPGHAGIGAPYAHVTAPLRRLVDRFGTELCLALTTGATVPDWLRTALPGLPETMAASDAVAGAVSRACVDRTEAVLLADRVGADFDAVVLRAASDNGAGEVYLLDPPVLARCTGVRQPGETARVRLVEASPDTGRISFAAGR